MESHSDILVVGAGIAGLLCASQLHAAGHNVRVLDKGRGLGGRMATRRMAGGRLDHGAQFFTVRDLRFQSHVDQWLRDGVIKEWFAHASEDTDPSGHPRYCGLNGMTDVAKHLARTLDVQNSQHVSTLARENEQWIVRTQSDQVFSATHLVITAPMPQALTLLDASGLDYATEPQRTELHAVRYEKGLATLAILDGPSGLPEPGGMKVDAAPLTWIADNQQKGISPDVPAITLHANASFAAEHWDSPNDVRGPLMLAAAQPYLKARVIEYNCHRWGFSLTVNPLPYSHFHRPELNLILAGDAFGAPRIEGAALSGLGAAQSILASL